MDLRKFVFLSLSSSIFLYSQDVNRLDELIITATKTENSLKSLTSTVQIVEDIDIENSGASNISEILSSTAGIYLSPSGNRFSIRGMNHSDTLILIDGKRVNGEFSKIFELERIPADMVKRIEILKGNSSLLYGSDAMGGVVNIITKKSSKDLSGSIQFLGSQQKKATDFFVSNKIGDTSFTFYSNYLDRRGYSERKLANIKLMHSGSAKSPSDKTLPKSGAYKAMSNSLSDNYIIDNDYLSDLELKNIGGSVSYDFNDDIKLSFDFSHLDETKENSYVSDSYPSAYLTPKNTYIMARNIPAKQYNDNERLNLAASLDYNISNQMNLKYNIAYSKYEKDRKTYTPLYKGLGYTSIGSSAFSVNQSVLKYLNNDILFTHTLNKYNRYILGAEHRINDTDSTAFNVNNRTYTSYFAQHEYTVLEDLKFIYGARYDKTSIDENEISLSFGTIYKINDNLSIRGNYSEGFRSPDDRELYVDQTTPTGKRKLGASVVESTYKKLSNELKSEKSKTFELGLIGNYDIFDFELTAYKTDVDDRISEVSYGNYSTFENISDSEIKGFESSISFSLIEKFFVKLNFTYTDGKNETENINLIEIPEKTADFVLSYYPTENIELKSITKYVGSQYSDEYEKLGGYTITNLKANITNIVENTDFYVGVDNVFNKQMDEYLGYIPQSSIYAGIKYRF